MSFCGLTKEISLKICILCSRVKINKHLFEPFCVQILQPIRQQLEEQCHILINQCLEFPTDDREGRNLLFLCSVSLDSYISVKLIRTIRTERCESTPLSIFSLPHSHTPTHVPKTHTHARTHTHTHTHTVIWLGCMNSCGISLTDFFF